jgi:hypothetical protein
MPDAKLGRRISLKTAGLSADLLEQNAAGARFRRALSVSEHWFYEHW